MVALAAFMTLAAHAQFYAGGSVSFQSGDNGRIYLAPEAGYNFNDNFAVGAVVAFDQVKDWSAELTLNPYIRWTFADWAPFKLFLDGSLAFSSVSTKFGEEKTYSAMEFGVKPGISLPVNENLQLVAHLGFVGFAAADDELQNMMGYNDGVIANFSGKALNVGIFYCF